MKYLLSILTVLSLLISCQNSDIVHDDKDQAEEHDHGGLSIVVFNENMELFAETDQLFVKHEISIRAHLTFLKNYSPADKGKLYTRIVQSNQQPDWQELEFQKAGIFTGSVSPNKPGLCSFEFKYIVDNKEILFSQDSLEVFTHDNAPAEEEHHDEIVFTKEQAWHTEFGLLPVEVKDFSTVIHCSGEIEIASGDLVELTAPASGKIIFSNHNLVIGQYVKKGSVLLSLQGTGLGQNNIRMELNTAKAEYEKSKANFERKKRLLKIEAVSQKDYEEARATYQSDLTRYDILKSQLSKSGIMVKSPVSGFITEILSSSNSYAETGSVLVKIIRQGGLLIKANVPSTEVHRINSVVSANCKLPSDPSVFSINDWDGELTSIGRSVDPETGMLPVFFTINKPGLIPGTFVELWLLTDTLKNQIIIPESSLLEEYGNYYVYVQKEGESYEKRAIQISDNDGINYLVTDGIHPGEVVVSKGVMAIKVANAMGAVPVHHHH